MIIAKYYRTDNQDKFLSSWCSVPEYILEREWMEILNKHRKFIEDYFPSSLELVSELPVLKIDANELPKRRRYELIRLKLNNRKDYNSPIIGAVGDLSEIDLEPADALLLMNIREVFSDILASRIEYLFITKFPNIFNNDKYTPLTKVKSLSCNFDNVEKLVRDVFSSKITTGYFHRKMTEDESENFKKIANISKSEIYYFGKHLTKVNSALIAKKHRPSLSYDFSEIAKVVRTSLTKSLTNEFGLSTFDVDNITFIPNIPIYLALKNYSKVNFRLFVFKNDTCVIEKRGRVINYAFMEMIYKVFEDIESSKDTDKWVMYVSTLGFH